MNAKGHQESVVNIQLLTLCLVSIFLIQNIVPYFTYCQQQFLQSLDCTRI